MPSSTGATALEQLELKCLGQVSLVFNIELRNNLELQVTQSSQITEIERRYVRSSIVVLPDPSTKGPKQWKVPLRGDRDGALCRFPIGTPQFLGMN